MAFRVVHVITDFETGGAQWMLYRLVTGPNPRRVEHRVVSLCRVGALGERLREGGVDVQALGLHEGGHPARAVLRLARILREARPDAVQTWMYHANLLGGLAARLAGCRAVHWGIHHTDLEPAITKRRTLLVDRACARVSRIVPRSVVYCAGSSLAVHLRRGYTPANATVIPNGFDIPPLETRERARRELRERLGLPPDAFLVGRAGRYDAQKDFPTFLRAAALAAKDAPKARFLLWGLGVDAGNEELASLARDGGASDRVHILGYVDDPDAITAGLDVMVSSSRSGEAFPLVVGEAMAAGVPCVVTDVGDSAALVGDAGLVVPPRDPVALAEAIVQLAQTRPEELDALGRRARARMLADFSLQSVADRYQRLWIGADAPEVPA